jgi:hypothetical protein
MYTYAYDTNNLISVPVALHVCFESRQETLKNYRVVTRPRSDWVQHHQRNRRFPFTFNPDLDIGVLQRFAARWGMPGHCFCHCRGLLRNLSLSRDQCSTPHFSAGVQCGNWVELMEKHAPGLIEAVRSVFITEVDWDDTTKYLLQKQIIKPMLATSKRSHSPDRTRRISRSDHSIKAVFYGPLLHFSSLTELFLGIGNWWYSTVRTGRNPNEDEKDMKRSFHDFLTRNVVRNSGLQGPSLRISCTLISPEDWNAGFKKELHSLPIKRERLSDDKWSPGRSCGNVRQRGYRVVRKRSSQPMEARKG